jgi:hypothetical protein
MMARNSAQHAMIVYMAEVTQATPQGLHTFRPSGRIAKSEEADPARPLPPAARAQRAARQ